MSSRRRRRVAIALLSALMTLSACASLPPRERLFEDEVRQQQLRHLQTATFAVPSRIKALRALITTLQDLDFVIDQADSPLGFISATKLNGYNLHVSVMVDETAPGRVAIRVSFAAGPMAIADAAYREFFASLQQNLAVNRR